MRVSLKWLEDYLNINVSPSELASRLMMSGNEVKAIDTIGAGWDNIVVGRVTAISPHPNADRLRLVTVDTGKDQQTVVCGAFNFTTGDKIVFASLGAELTDGHTGERVRLKAARIRGVESRGMICSEKELGISQDHTGILVLPADAPLGLPLRDYLGDTIIDLDVTPNRPDCLSVIGIARESAALTGQTVTIPEVKYVESTVPIEEKISVEIQAPDLCPRYCASLITGIQIKASPEWMQDRLLASGLRPINNIVDISNYVMLEYGQPLHTFDYDKIAGKKILVRRAGEGEVIVSLDGIERELDPKMLVISDAWRAVAVAGVMGGANTEVTEATRNILLEAASFKPESIHYTGDALGLQSESRYRFERGIAPGLTLPALKRATQLIADLGDGKAARGWIDVYPGEMPDRPVLLSIEKLKRLLGVEFTLQQVTDTLVSLGFECRNSSSPSQLVISVPYWRSDIHIEVDLIEEVSRILGYDKIPSTLLAEPLPRMNPDPLFNLKRDVRLSMVADGFSEVINFSLVGMETLRKLSSERTLVGPRPLRVTNPMTAEMEYLRTTLRSSLLSAFATNRRHKEDGIRLFEVGKIYLRRDRDLPDERETVCGVMGGLRYSRSWQNNDELLDFFDVKGIVERLLQRLGLDYRFEKGEDAGLHLNKQAAVSLDEKKIGVMGEVHPKVLSAFEIAEPVYLLEIDLKSLAPFIASQKSYRQIPRFPSIIRDMALIVDMSVTHQQIKEIIEGFPLVEQVDIFDVYSGGQVESGKKSLAYRISYRSFEHTLTDEEVNQVQKRVLDRLGSKLGAVLRS